MVFIVLSNIDSSVFHCVYLKYFLFYYILLQNIAINHDAPKSITNLQLCDNKDS